MSSSIFISLSNNDWITILKSICTFLSNNIDNILNISILLSCIFIYINIKKVIILMYPVKDNNIEKINKFIVILKKLYWFIFIFLWLFILYYDYICSDNYIFSYEFIVYKRTIKFCLAFLLNSMTIYINYNSYGFKSWRTYLSLFSMLITIIIAFSYYNDVYLIYYKEVVHGVVAMIFSLIYLYFKILDDSSLHNLKMGMLINVKECNELIKWRSESQVGPNLMVGSEDKDNEINIGENKSSGVNREDEIIISLNESNLSNQNKVDESSNEINKELNKELDKNNIENISEININKEKDLKKVKIVEPEHEDKSQVQEKGKKKRKLFSNLSNKEDSNKNNSGKSIGSSFIEKLRSNTSISKFKPAKLIEYNIQGFWKKEVIENKLNFKENKNFENKPEKLEDETIKKENMVIKDISKLKMISGPSVIRDNKESLLEGNIEISKSKIKEKEEELYLSNNELFKSNNDTVKEIVEKSKELKEEVESISSIERDLIEIMERGEIEEKKRLWYLAIQEKELEKLTGVKSEEYNINEEDIKENESVFELKDERDKDIKWVDGLNAYLARWKTEMEMNKLEIKEEKIEHIKSEVNKEDTISIPLGEKEDFSILIRRELNKDISELKSKSFKLKPILKSSELGLKDNVVNYSTKNEEIINSNNEISKKIELEKELDKINYLDDQKKIKEIKKKPIIKKTLDSMRDVFHISNKSKSEYNTKMILKPNLNESKSFIEKIKPKVFQLGSKNLEQEILKMKLEKVEENKVKWMLDSINFVDYNNPILNIKYNRELWSNEYLLSSLSLPNLDKLKEIKSNLNEIKLKDNRLEWKDFLIKSESDLLSKLMKQWMLTESIKHKNLDYIPITELDLLIMPNMKFKSTLTSDGKLQLIKEEKVLSMNSLKIKLLDLIEKYPMGMKETNKRFNDSMPPILMIDPSCLKNIPQYLYKDILPICTKEQSELSFDNKLIKKLVLKNKLSDVLLEQYIEEKNTKKYTLVKPEELAKLLDVKIVLRKPWSEALINSEYIEKENFFGKIFSEKDLLINNIDRTLPFFKRLVPSSPLEYYKICDEMGQYKEKAEQIIKWNEWAIYQILETHSRVNNGNLVTRDFVWYNEDYTPFYGPLPNNIEWRKNIKNEFNSFKEVQYAQEILLKKELPISWQVIQYQNEFWDKEYKLFQKDYKTKMWEIENKLYDYLNNLYIDEKKEWLKIYDLSRRLINNTYNWEMASKYDEIEQFFLKENGYSYRERIWEFDKILARENQNWSRLGKVKSVEYKKRIAELDLKWEKSTNAVEKLRQNIKSLDLEKSKIEVIEEKNSSDKNNKVFKENDINSSLDKERNSFSLAYDNKNESFKNENKSSNIFISSGNKEENTIMTESLNNIYENEVSSYALTNNEKGKYTEIKMKDKGKSPEVQLSIDRSDEILNIEEFVDKNQLLSWVKNDQNSINHSGWSTIPDDQIIPESSKDAERRAKNYINYIKEEKMFNKAKNYEEDLMQSNIYDYDIIASRRNKPLTIQSKEWKETVSDVSKSKLEDLDILLSNKKIQDISELDKSVLNKEKYIINKKNEKEESEINIDLIKYNENKIRLLYEKLVEEKKAKLELIEEKKAKLDLEKKISRKERKTNLTEVLTRGKEIPVYKYRGDDRFLDSDSEESVHEQKFDLYPEGHYLDPITNKVIKEEKIIQDSLGSTMLSPALPNPLIKPKIRTFIPPGHEWGLSFPVPSDFVLLNDPMFITNSRYGPYGSERFIRNLLYNKEVPRNVDTDYRDGFISVWKNNDITQSAYALLDQRIPKMIQEDLNKQNFDIDNSRARYLDNDQEWDIMKKIDKNDNKDIVIEKNDKKRNYNTKKVKERIGESRETIFIREGNTYLVARRNIEVDKKALEYLSKAVIDMFGEAHANIVRPDVNMWAAWTSGVNSRQIATRNQILEFLKGRNWGKMNFIEALQYGTLDVYIRTEKFGEINLEVSRDDQHVTRGNQAAKDYVIRISTAKLIREEEVWLWKKNLKRLEKIGMPDEIESLKEKIAEIERTHERVKYGLIRNNFIKERHLILPEELNNKPYSW